MIAIWAVLIVFIGHWLADFVWQPDWMGKGKSKSWAILSQHAWRITVGSYAVAITVALGAGVTHRPALVWLMAAYALINGASHFVIDAVTSRITSRMYAQGRTHGFFTTIGFDQLLHMVIAVATLGWLVYA